MRVVVTCEDCGRSVEIHVIGGWDIRAVRHTCEEDRLIQYPGVGQGRFGVDYDPPRRAF